MRFQSNVCARHCTPSCTLRSNRPPATCFVAKPCFRPSPPSARRADVELEQGEDHNSREMISGTVLDDMTSQRRNENNCGSLGRNVQRGREWIEGHVLQECKYREIITIEFTAKIYARS
ncbi:BZ3500_MvSof-1268-A1-R1_Chr2-1g04496 [Microbotryum saponariae]|uniref:BZ3500_MvSof-1268-A1-R1_Chr2-1g04496 protein n=1 Tax=Microbotryum saponariae TaxID=289078 RepID=A0A2X0K8U6_9BASI|nr:BZ3500_MvSof-1268-A1-R1_Chr2-1g04496 [Microbotryum saponariae]SCZ91842.1 BZ3501_MvSof-1269-A2-R1_Chr2-1g04152 [Microbotryum saponariae]